MKKVTSMVLLVIMVVAIMCNVDILANATDSIATQTVSTSNLSTLLNVATGTDNGVHTTNIGGISVGCAHNRLFVVKSQGTETNGTLYYYNNIYDTRFKNGTKLPKQITFKNGLLGHANAMAVDDDYIYVTRWQQSGTQKSSILQISRKAIGLLTTGSSVNTVNDTVNDENGNPVRICQSYSPKYAGTNTAYNRSITAITKYSYNATTHTTKFLINYGYSNDRTTLTYTIATLSNGQFTVSTSIDDMFNVNNPNANVTMQDIFYDSAYGMFIPMWTDGATSNKLLCVDIRGLKTQGKTERLNLTPFKILNINKSSDSNGSLRKYEIESLAFIKRDNDLNEINFRMIFSCNKEVADTGAQCDSIEEITNFGNYISRLT